MIHPRFAEMGLRYPIFQAPTGTIARPELAAAVAEAGAMGAMALYLASPEVAASRVAQVKSATTRPFMVNYTLAFPPNSLDAVLDAGAPVISFSWGDAAPYVDRVRRAGAKICVQATTRAGARRAADLGVDFIVCQGVEAGGHVQGTRPLLEALPEVLEAAGDIPVVAAGGIADGAAIARIMVAGAAGAMLGTRFVATRESGAHPEYRERLVAAAGGETTLTVCFEGGWAYAAHRVMRNSTLEGWEAAGCPPVGARPGEGDTVGFTAAGEAIHLYEDTAPRAGFTGDIEAMCLYAGAGCGDIHDIPAAAELVATLWAECEKASTGTTVRV